VLREHRHPKDHGVIHQHGLPTRRAVSSHWHFAARATAFALAVLASSSCSVYDSTLLDTGTLAPAGSGTTGESGSPGALGGGGFAGGRSVDGGAPSIGGSSTSGMAGSDETAGTGGKLSTGGTAGAGGAGGASGAPSGGGIGGTTGASGSGNTGGSTGGGASTTANGCARLSVPLDNATDKAHFVISLTTASDLSRATISMRLYVRAGSGGSIFNYVQDAGAYHFFSVDTAQRALLSSFSGWSTLTWDVGAQADSAATGIVKTSIKNIGIEIGAPPSSSWTSPTIVYIDSIAVKTPTLSFTFDGSSSVSPTATTTPAAEQAIWINGGATDTTAVGVTLSWQATCP
jgi:hypothetical protein